MGVSALELRRRVLMAQPHKERKTGGIVSFNTHVPQVLDVAVPLSPVQAGTGDPYPPGGGKNLADVQDVSGIKSQTQIKAGISLPAGTYTISAYIANSGTAGAALRVINGSNSLKTIGYSYSPTPTRFGGQFTLESATEDLKLSVVGNASGYDASVSQVQIEKGSTATDFAPYSNIRPISGYTGAAVWDDPKYGGLIKWNQLNALNAPNAWTTINEDGSVTITSTESTKTTYGHVSMLAETPFLSDHVYMLYTPGFFNDNGIRFYTARGSSDPIVAGKEARFYKNLASTQTFIRSVIPAHEGTVSVTTFVMLFDLTEMFGAEVADGIYSAPYETALSWFKSLFFKEWYPFNAGEITCVSAVNGETHRYQSVTFPAGCVNKWDEQIAKLTNTYYGSANFIPATPLTEYYIVSPVNIYPLYYDADQNEIGHGNWWKKRTFTTPENTRYIKFYIDPVYGATYKNDISINNPASITVYIPHDQAIFGGRYEPGEGRLLIDRLSFSYTDGVNVYQSQSNRFYMLITGAKRVDSSNQSTYAGVMCDRLKQTTWAGLAQDSGNVSCSPVWGAGVAFRDDRITTVDGWKEYLAENQLQFVFELAEPLIIPLTPAEIRALMGENNVFADTGDVDVEFWTN